MGQNFARVREGCGPETAKEESTALTERTVTNCTVVACSCGGDWAIVELAMEPDNVKEKEEIVTPIGLHTPASPPPAALPPATSLPAAVLHTPASLPLADRLPAASPASLPHADDATVACLSDSSKSESATPELQNTVTDSGPIASKRQKRSGKSTTAKAQKEYTIKFKGNSSGRWDGKVIAVDAEWLEELYSKEELGPGRIIELPWEGNDGKTVDWRAMIVTLPDQSDKSECTCIKLKVAITISNTTAIASYIL